MGSVDFSEGEKEGTGVARESLKELMKEIEKGKSKGRRRRRNVGMGAKKRGEAVRGVADVLIAQVSTQSEVSEAAVAGRKVLENGACEEALERGCVRVAASREPCDKHASVVRCSLRLRCEKKVSFAFGKLAR